MSVRRVLLLAAAFLSVAMPAMAQVTLPPSVPQPSVTGDIVGFNVQNTGGSPTVGTNYVTTGQMFKTGTVVSSNIQVKGADTVVRPAQLDPLAFWPDGSVKFGAVTIGYPAISAGATFGELVQAHLACGGNGPPVDLGALVSTLTVAMTVIAGPTGAFTHTYDLRAALLAAIAGGSPNYWLHGPLATQIRVDVLVVASLHLTADVTGYADGTVTADVQFNNDDVLAATGGTFQYAPVVITLNSTVKTLFPAIGSAATATATVSGGSIASVTLTGGGSGYTPGEYQVDVTGGGGGFNAGIVYDVNNSGVVTGVAIVGNGFGAGYTVPPTLTLNAGEQYQYQDWHVVLASAARPTLNIQHDVAYLEATGAVLPYDLTSGVANSTIAGYATMNASPGYGAPLQGNGITYYMGQTGGRADIGYTTQWASVWLITQDATTAATVLAQGDTAGAIPWNYKQANGRWFNPSDYPDYWTAENATPGLTQNTRNKIWQIDTAHQPNLSYIPYIMTASRWNLDRLNAQASDALMATYPPARCLGVTCSTSVTGVDHLINDKGGDQVRAQAWNMREMEEAAFIGKSGTWEATYYPTVVDDNWAWLLAQIPSWTTAQGAAAGWIYGDNAGGAAIASWQQDYFDGTTELGALMGNANASSVVSWMHNYNTGRFVGSGMNIWDGCAAYLVLLNTVTPWVPYTTWTAIEAATVSGGISNGTASPNAWAQSQGDYCPLAHATLGAYLALHPGDSAATTARTWVDSVTATAPYDNIAAFQADPTFAVGPPPAH